MSDKLPQPIPLYRAKHYWNVKCVVCRDTGFCKSRGGHGTRIVCWNCRKSKEAPKSKKEQQAQAQYKLARERKADCRCIKCGSPALSTSTLCAECAEIKNVRRRQTL